MMRTYIWAIATFSSLVISLSCGSNAAQDRDIVINKIDRMVESILNCKPAISGLSLAVVKDGQPILQKGFGVANRELGLNVTENTLIQIASLSKAFTTTLLMKILDKIPNVTVDTPVTKILQNDFRFYTDELNLYATIQDLMSHRLGLPTHNYIRFTNITRKELARRFRYIKPTGEFRSTYYYNNIVYGLLTYITEVLGKDTWENLMRQEIFEPLGMSRSTFAHTLDSEDKNVAIGYNTINDGEFDKIPRAMSTQWGKLGGSGSIMSTAVDMTAWMILHLSLGKSSNGSSIVNNRTIKNNHAPKVVMSSSINKYITVPEFPTTFVVDRYAAAWRNGFYRGVPTVSHTGSTFGYRAIMMLYPEQDLGIFMALNGNDRSVFTRTALQSYIADLVLGYEPWLNTTTVCTFPRPWKKATTPGSDPQVDKNVQPQLPLDAYVGKYSTPLYGVMDITKNTEANCSNCLELTYGIATWDLYPMTFAHKFYALGTGAVNFWRLFTITFKVPKGKTQATAVHLRSFDARAPPELKRLKAPCTSGCGTKQPPVDDKSRGPPMNSQWAALILVAIMFLQIIFYVV